MVKIEEIIELGLRPAYSITMNNACFICSDGKGKNFKELRILYNFNTTDCEIEFAEYIEGELEIKQIWSGKIKTIEELEDRLQDGEY